MDKWDLVYESPSIVLKNKLGRKSNNSENEMKTSSLKYISETHTNKVKIYTDGSKDPTTNTVLSRRGFCGPGAGPYIQNQTKPNPTLSLPRN